MPKIKKSGHEVTYVAGEGYQYTHRIKMEEKLGRSLRKGEVVHHKNGDPSDNRSSNLELASKGRHNTIDKQLHHGGRDKKGK